MVLMFLILIASATALKECKGVMASREIPCELITTWDYPLDCDLYNMTIYDQTPEILDWRNLTNYTGTDRCNTTFNYTTKGSYLFNTSNGGDSGRIIIEDENIIAIILGLITILVFFGLLARLSSNFGLKVFGYGVSLIQLIDIAFVLYANEVGTSLVTTLKVNFYSILILGFAIAMVILIRFVARLVDPIDNLEEKNDPKW